MVARRPKIAFISGSFSGQIVTVSVGSTQETVVATCSSCLGYMDPTWSPDGSKIAAMYGSERGPRRTGVSPSS